MHLDECCMSVACFMSHAHRLARAAHGVLWRGSDEERASETGAADAEARAAAAAARAEQRLARVHVSQPCRTGVASELSHPIAYSAAPKRSSCGAARRRWRTAHGPPWRWRRGRELSARSRFGPWAPLSFVASSLLRLALCFVHSLTVR